VAERRVRGLADQIAFVSRSASVRHRHLHGPTVDAQQKSLDPDLALGIV
jgi:hypothetical protein